MTHLLARIAPRTRRMSLPTVGALALALAAFAPLLWLYGRSAAPSVLAGDSAEFQFASPLLGVPHPTGYPLLVLLGKLATLAPFGDVAHRVTLLSALLAAATCAVVALVALELTRRPLAALLSALALGVTPGVWNIATIAEAYALNLLLIAGLGYALAQKAKGKRQKAQGEDQAAQGERQKAGWLVASCFICGLGVSHHGSFAFIAAPLLLATLAWKAKVKRQKVKEVLRERSFYLLPFAFLLGLSPWLYVLGSYAVWGPFSGDYHGLPRHYFWGAPQSWGEALAHLAGGPLRGEVFALPDGARLLVAYEALRERMRFEWGTLGLLLGAFGCAALLWRNWRVWLATAWVFVVTAIYFACLSRAVQDALIFTLPMLLPWALWVGCGAAALCDGVEWLVRPQTADRRPQTAGSQRTASKTAVGGREQSEQSAVGGRERSAVASAASSRRSAVGAFLTAVLLCTLLALTLQWGRTRLPYGNKHDQWLFRQFGEGALQRLEPNAVVLARWEPGTILLYLHLVEGQRPDVLLDVVEPEDWPWGPRVAERYATRPVYIVGAQPDADALGARPVWRTDYAALFRLR